MIDIQNRAINVRDKAADAFCDISIEAHQALFITASGAALFDRCQARQTRKCTHYRQSTSFAPRKSATTDRPTDLSG
jgi:hypothetical protein